jgi:hypothetical protein
LHGRNLGQRVYASVGAARALWQDILTGKSLQAIGQRALHRSESGLHLPAMKFRAIVGKGYLEVSGHASPEQII